MQSRVGKGRPVLINEIRVLPQSVVCLHYLHNYNFPHIAAHDSHHHSILCSYYIQKPIYKPACSSLSISRMDVIDIHIHIHIIPHIPSSIHTTPVHDHITSKIMNSITKEIKKNPPSKDPLYNNKAPTTPTPAITPIGVTTPPTLVPVCVAKPSVSVPVAVARYSL